MKSNPIDRLGLAITNAGYEWSGDMRLAWEQTDNQIGHLKTALKDILRFHEEGEDGLPIPREYWSTDYRKAVESAEFLL